ncbi:delta-like protein 1 [Caerostris extrusa]|uniref:Delta-like protein n=1 Tax=Caerostris extrusa TaxID=172846 RepID=A0AAV4TLA8_CAEEX|nr:delta-like protein 1 [Caerostris extrusa]
MPSVTMHCAGNLALCVVILLAFVSQAECSGMFEIRLDNFVNEFGRDADGTCCRGVRSPSGMCSGTCRTRFRVCLKHYQTTIDPNPPCTYGEVLTPVLGNNSVQLDTINDPETGFTNPIVFSFDFSWVGTFSLIVEAWHEGEPNSTPGPARKLITRLATQRWLDVSQYWTQDIHKTNHTAFSYAIRVRCLDNYYGENCEKLCRPRNDKFGHYTCSPTGDKVCHRGWKGEYCTIAVCLPGCHEDHGFCDQPNECKCRLDGKVLIATSASGILGASMALAMNHGNAIAMKVGVACSAIKILTIVPITNLANTVARVPILVMDPILAHAQRVTMVRTAKKKLMTAYTSLV